MSAGSLMSLGVKALAANYAALQTTGHNIANANVNGYSRQRAELNTSIAQFTGAGYFGRGVDVATVSQSYDGFLTRQTDGASSVAAMDAARHAQLQRLEAWFKPGETGLGHATTQLMDALVDLSSNPVDSATRRVVLARAADMASRFDEAAQGLDTVQAGVWSDLRSAVADVNALAGSIARVNRSISDARIAGHSPNDLLDERNRLVADLSRRVQVTRMEASDGTLSVFVGGGQSLVLGTSARELVLTPDAADGTRARLGLQEGSLVRTLDGSALGSGEIAGLLRFQNEDLVSARALLGQLAASVGGAVNRQQELGLNLQRTPGTVPSQPLFELGPAQALPNAANARDPWGTPLGGVTLEIADPAALRALEYDLRQDPASGVWQLRRLPGGEPQNVADGDVVDGMRIRFTGAPQMGDSFLLQPVSRAANGMKALLTDPRDLAAASPLIATTSPGNQGTLAVGALQMRSAPVDGASVTISFFSDNGDYSWDLLDRDGNSIGGGGGTWRGTSQLPEDGSLINGFALQLSGVPRSGDTISVVPTPAGAVSTNNGNALALMALRDAALSEGRTATDAWAMALSEVGVRVQSADTAREISASVFQSSEAQRSATSGVNLDEEAARLIQFQQSYQAAAKVLQVAQTLFDTLLQATAR